MTQLNTSNTTDYSAMLQVLQNQRNMLLLGHEDPDCDCLGSLLGLYLTFGGAEKNWQIVAKDTPPENLLFLPGISSIKHPDEIDWPAYDAVMLVDCGEAKRTGDYLEQHLPGKKFYCIDHHMSNSFAGDLAVVDAGAAAAAEIIADICLSHNIAISDDAALNLYSAISADTGGFRFPSTSKRTLSIAAALVEQVDLELVAVKLFEDCSLANLKLKGCCLENMQVDAGGKLAYTWISIEEMRRYSATVMDCHDIVNNTLKLRGVKFGLMFEEHEGFVKMSFRSRKDYRVDELARRLGGGGHMRAAGCKMDGALPQVMPVVLAEVRAEMQAQDAARD